MSMLKTDLLWANWLNQSHQLQRTCRRNQKVMGWTNHVSTLPSCSCQARAHQTQSEILASDSRPLGLFSEPMDTLPILTLTLLTDLLTDTVGLLVGPSTKSKLCASLNCSWGRKRALPPRAPNGREIGSSPFLIIFLEFSLASPLTLTNTPSVIQNQ